MSRFVHPEGSRRCVYRPFSKLIWALLTRILCLFTSATRMSTLGALLLLSFRFPENVLSADYVLATANNRISAAIKIQKVSLQFPLHGACQLFRPCMFQTSLCTCPWFAKEKVVLFVMIHWYSFITVRVSGVGFGCCRDASLRRLFRRFLHGASFARSTDDKSSFVNAFSVISKIRCL